MKHIFKIKRVYAESDIEDGQRILVDRIWPRGISKVKAHINDWKKELAPSTELRKWFGHDPLLWTSFRKKYKRELTENKSVVDFLHQLKGKKIITLIYGAKDEKHNQAVVLREFLQQFV